jgi:hypothetical protein
MKINTLPVNNRNLLLANRDKNNSQFAALTEISS